MTTRLQVLCNALRGKFQGRLNPRRRSRIHPKRAKSGTRWRRVRRALIARCADVADVQLAVRFAAESGVLTAVRCGGHSLAGFGSCDGGLVIDFRGCGEWRVDASARRAKFGGGCLLGTVDTATQRDGLVFPAGVVSHTGAGGLVLGGGTGWLTRLHGLSCDNVLGFALVTADGSLVRANEAENPDLFWALRGGGGNFGVVTEFEVRLHSLTSVLLATSYCHQDDIVRVLQDWRDFMPGAPDALKWNISVVLAPNDDRVPGEIRGRPALSLSVVWFGDEAEGSRQVDRIFSLGKQFNLKKETFRIWLCKRWPTPIFRTAAAITRNPDISWNLRDRIIEMMVGCCRFHSFAEHANRTGLPGRRSGTRRCVGNGFRRPQRSLHLEFAGGLERPGGRRCEYFLGAKSFQRAAPEHEARRVRQFHERRRAGPRPRSVSGAMAALGENQDSLRPRKFLPPESEHPAAYLCIAAPFLRSVRYCSTSLAGVQSILDWRSAMKTRYPALLFSLLAVAVFTPYAERQRTACSERQSDIAPGNH